MCLFRLEEVPMSEQVKVLVVDDEKVVLQSVRKVLRTDDEHEFVVDTVLSPKEGLALLNQWKYDIVITDLMMPGIDGLQFIDSVRDSCSDTKVIMITGYATMRTALQALRKGAFDYIAKPFTKEELRNIVKNAIRALNAPEATANSERAGETSEQYLSFLNQTYARLLPDGGMYFGVEPAFLDITGEPLCIEIPAIDEKLTQGFPFGSITNTKMRVYNLRAPFSGHVLEVNQEAVDNTGLVVEDPRGKGWLIQVMPSDLKKEKENLNDS